MMRDRSLPSYCVISPGSVLDFTAGILGKGPVMGPMVRPDQPGFHVFDRLRRPEDLVLEYTTTTMPPKKAFFPPTETVFRFSAGDPPNLTPVRGDPPWVLLGVHPCDLSAIDALDRAYSFPPPDRRWRHNRDRSIIVGVDCMPDEYCFCDSLGVSQARRPCDLFLTEIERGYLVETHTRAGGELLGEARTSNALGQDFLEAEHRRRQKALGIQARLSADPGRLADFLEAEPFQEIWEDIAARCYSCGSCNTTCPACFCFTMDDVFHWDLQSGERRRAWDSCQLLDFAAVAGGHRFREDRWQRVRHRWHRKFLHLYRRFGRPFCTGCGRCSRACTADINILDETNRIIAAATKGRGHA
ncbi:MAG: 4Fe-4S dicluster domain-containing protein [Deltaproteobacteria bacterium]|nr:4Fe-4S dicluster domain-containing protein [Deltaproteobacteria bacterium]